MADAGLNRAGEILFLPGASGDGRFWQRIGARLPATWKKTYLNWPGLGNQPHDAEVRSLDDLLRKAEQALQRPSAIVAQSMGGIIAIQLALKHPDRVTHLVLAATSGGLDVAALGAADWRPEFLEAYPRTARWILTEKPDLGGSLHSLNVPTLLLWGDDDPVSPLAVGEHLARRINDARLVVIPGGRHAMAFDLPDAVAPLVHAHLARSVAT